MPAPLAAQLGEEARQKHAAAAAAFVIACLRCRSCWCDMLYVQAVEGRMVSSACQVAGMPVQICIRNLHSYIRLPRFCASSDACVTSCVLSCVCDYKLGWPGQYLTQHGPAVPGVERVICEPGVCSSSSADCLPTCFGRRQARLLLGNRWYTAGHTSVVQYVLGHTWRCPAGLQMSQAGQ